MELSIATRAVATALGVHKVDLVRIWHGLVMTSLDMAGISVTLLPLPDEGGAELLELLDAPTSSMAWPGRASNHLPRVEVRDLPEAIADKPNHADHDERVRTAIDAVCAALLAQEDELTQLDQTVGDGDLGTALARGARAWLARPAQRVRPPTSCAAWRIARRRRGGRSDHDRRPGSGRGGRR